MKGTSEFRKAIEDYIATRDDVNVNKHPGKTIDGCIDYIFTQVKASGCCGFADEEIYGMAVHYFDEPDEALGEIKHLSPQVVVNHHVDLSSEEIEKAKKEALEEVKRQQIESVTKREKKPARSAASASNELTLF